MVRRIKKKIIFTFLITLIILIFTSLICYAKESDDIYESYMQSSGAKDLIDNVPYDVKNTLRDLGIDDISFESIYNISFKTVLKEIIDIIADKAEHPFKALVCMFGIIILISIAKLFQTSQKIESVLNLIAALVSAVVIIIPLSKSLASVISAIKLSSNFMLSFIPVFVGLIAVSGNPILAFSYNSLVLVLAEVITQISEKILSPFTSMIISLNLVASVTDDVHIDKASQFIRNVSITIMTFLATIFTGFLSVKSILSNSADTVSAKGIKFFAGNVIPIIGSSISDAYSSIAGSLGLLKSALGIFGIIVVIIINFPIIAEICIWIFSMYICEIITEFFGEKKINILISGTLKALQIVLAILILNLFLMTISTGIILTVKADL